MLSVRRSPFDVKRCWDAVYQLFTLTFRLIWPNAIIDISVLLGTLVARKALYAMLADKPPTHRIQPFACNLRVHNKQDRLAAPCATIVLST